MKGQLGKKKSLRIGVFLGKRVLQPRDPPHKHVVVAVAPRHLIQLGLKLRTVGLPSWCRLWRGLPPLRLGLYLRRAAVFQDVLVPCAGSKCGQVPF